MHKVINMFAGMGTSLLKRMNNGKKDSFAVLNTNNVNLSCLENGTIQKDFSKNVSVFH